MRASVLLKWHEISAAATKAQIKAKTSIFPSTVDFNIIGRCNLNCTWCWGPSHDAKESVTLSTWKNILKLLHNNGTRNLVISGGEPLLKKWLGELARYAKIDMNMHVTLSTNGILLKQKGPDVLPYVHDLGIPLDGHNHEINKIMRVGQYKHIDYALDALHYAQHIYPDIELTLRTVVAQPNLASVPLIGKTILAHGIKPEHLRWKLYQVNPLGPREEDIKKGEWLISTHKFNEIVEKTKMLNPSFNIVPQPICASHGRYFIIFPDGRAHVVNDDHEEIILGNIAQDPEKVIEVIKNTDYLTKNHTHGVRSYV